MHQLFSQSASLPGAEEEATEVVVAKVGAVTLANTRAAKETEVAGEKSSQASIRPTLARIPTMECTPLSETRDTETPSQLCKEMSRDRCTSRNSKIVPTNGKPKSRDAMATIVAAIVKMTSLLPSTTLPHQSILLSPRANKSKYLFFIR